jgi:hypothetical protein
MREQKSLDFSAARATTPGRFQVVALHWKAAVEGGTAHLIILTCRWLASNGRQLFLPTVRFIGLPMKPDVFGQAMPATLTFAFPHGKRSRMATVYAAPFTHLAGLISSKCVGAPPMELFRRSGQCRST